MNRNYYLNYNCSNMFPNKKILEYKHFVFYCNMLLGCVFYHLKIFALLILVSLLATAVFFGFWVIILVVLKCVSKFGFKQLPSTFTSFLLGDFFIIMLIHSFQITCSNWIFCLKVLHLGWLLYKSNY